MSKLVDIAKLNMGQSPPSSSYNDDGNGLPFYQGKSDFGYIHPIPRKYCSSPSKIAKKGDILISVRAPVGPVNIADTECCIGRGIAAITAKTFDQLFIYFSLIYQEGYIASLGTGSTFKAINKSQLETVNIPDFPLPEQRKIAYVLSTVQKAIEQQDKLIRTTTELKKALMQKLFTEGLNYDLNDEMNTMMDKDKKNHSPSHNQKNQSARRLKQTEIGLVPESWEEITIGDLGKCVTGTTPKTAVEEYWNSNDFDFIAPADIGNTKYVYNSAKMMSNEGLKVSRILPKNSVLCVCIGSSIGKVGLTFKDQSATNQQINSIICKADYNPIYTYYLLVQYAEHWRGHATFGPVPILNKGQFELIKIFVTKDKKEQSLIAESLQTFDNKIEFHGKKKQSLNDLFKTLLHELMTGERRVHEIEFEKMSEPQIIND